MSMSLKQLRPDGPIFTVLTNTVKKFASYFERQDTIQNAVLSLKMLFLATKSAFLMTKTLF